MILIFSHGVHGYSTYPEQAIYFTEFRIPGYRIQSPSPDWEKQIRELAKNQNLSCKVSGLLTVAAIQNPGNLLIFIPSWIFFLIHSVLKGCSLPVTGPFSYWPECMCNGKACWKNSRKISVRKNAISFLEKMPHRIYRL